ncbi:MAG: hypothetical protein M3133_01455 [Actinomycetota bacterium]|nr:hypothetical protein [Actinomycetota bacterium]
MLDHVEVVETATTVTITLYEGHTGRDIACIELAVQKATLVELEEPLGSREVIDGAKSR